MVVPVVLLNLTAQILNLVYILLAQHSAMGWLENVRWNMRQRSRVLRVDRHLALVGRSSS